MKRIAAILFMTFLFACNDDNEGDQVCTNKLWNLSTTGGLYFATYGPTQNDVGTIEVNEATYNHYIEMGNVTDGSICWEGTEA